MTFTEYPYNNLRKRFGALLSDQGFDLMNKCEPRRAAGLPQPRPPHCAGLQLPCFPRFLTYFPGRRVSAEDGLKHEYFRETPLPIDPSMFPTWPAKSEQQRVKRGTSPRPPEGGLGYSQLVRGGLLGEGKCGRGSLRWGWPGWVPTVLLVSQGDDDLKETGFHLTTTNQGASAAGPGFSLKF